ncbi:hypothetical protein ACS7SF_16295 [Ralstonia sp. 25C]|uniref:hypothetical protein n=1 Tax=Ralstonia sp. 25C TaxID=3447363 RepID=UPI003F754BFB
MDDDPEATNARETCMNEGLRSIDAAKSGINGGAETRERIKKQHERVAETH